MNLTSILSNMPAWATTDEAKAFVAGFAAGAIIRIFRAAARWAANIGDHTGGPSD